MSHRSCPGKVTPFRSFKLLQDFLRRRQLYTLFLLPNIKDVHPKTPCCHFQIRCRARSSVITGTMWELPKNSCGTISQGSLSPVGLEARLDRQHSSAQLSTSWEGTGLTCMDHWSSRYNRLLARTGADEQTAKSTVGSNSNSQRWSFTRLVFHMWWIGD